MASIDVLSSGVLLAIFDYLPAANSVAVCLASLAMSKQLAPWKAKVDAAVEEARRNLDVFAEVGLQLPTLLEPTQPSYTFDYHDPHNGLVRLSRRVYGLPVHKCGNLRRYLHDMGITPLEWPRYCNDGRDDVPEGFDDAIQWLENHLADQIWFPALHAPMLPLLQRRRFQWPPTGRRCNFHVVYLALDYVGCIAVFHELLEDDS